MDGIKSVWLLLVVLTFSFSSHSAVWEADPNAKWDEAQERDYAEWVQEKMHPTVFNDGKSPYFGIPLDCADFVYTSRILYSYEKKLPFEIYSGRFKKTISNKMTRWDNPDTITEKFLKWRDDQSFSIKDQVIVSQAWGMYSFEQRRLWMFIRYVSDITSTWTLPHHAVPIAINRDDVIAGKISLIRRNHSRVLTGVDIYGNIHALNATSPVNFMDLGDKKNINKELLSSHFGEEGLLAFRWPEEMKKNRLSVERTSMDQKELWDKALDSVEDEENPETIAFKIYQQFIKFGDGEITDGLALEEEPLEGKLGRAFDHYCDYAKQRATVVRDTVKYLETIDQCMPRVVYDAYSTPGRDKKLLKSFQVLFDLVMESGDRWTEIEDAALRRGIHYLFQELKDAEVDLEGVDGFSGPRSESRFVRFLTDVFTAGSYEGRRIELSDLGTERCLIDTGLKSRMYLADLTKHLVAGKLSSDPHAPLEARWGYEEYTPVCEVPASE